MKFVSSLYNKAAEFKKSGDGSIVPMTALMITTLALVSGAVIDYSRYSNAKTVLNSALDAAVLDAGARLGDGQPVDAKFEADFNAFFQANIVGRDGVASDYTIVNFSADAETGEVFASGEANLNTSLMSIGGFDNLKVETTTGGVFTQTDTEVTIMLDVTGSMEGSKIRALRSAASSAVDILLPKGNETRNTRIGLVPYASSINVGPSIAGRVTRNNSNLRLANIGDFTAPANNIPTNDCVTGRGGRDAATDAFYAPDALIGSDRRTVGRDLDTLFRCPRSVIRPLTNDLGALKTDIQGIEARGGTAGHLGVAWSYYMLSENWRPLWPQGNKPAPKSNSVTKVAILMTDGDFNTAFEGVQGEVDLNPGTFSLGPFGNTQSIAKSNSVAANLCTNMKNDGIIVYTIGFDLDGIADPVAKARATTLLDNCATDDVESQIFFYRADNEEELEQAFRSIAQNISSLRLTQ